MFEKEEPQEEYIVTSSDVYEAHNLYSENGYADSIGKFYKSLDRIIRCRDCKYFVDIDGPYCSMGNKQGAKVSENDFCAWGEVRNG